MAEAKRKQINTLLSTSAQQALDNILFELQSFHGPHIGVRMVLEMAIHELAKREDIGLIPLPLLEKEKTGPKSKTPDRSVDG